MRKFAKLAALSVLMVCSTSAMEAGAHNGVVDPTKLPDASKPYKAPLRIQVVPEGPIVTSTPTAPEGRKLFVVDTTLPAVPAPQIIRLTSGGAGGGLPPGVVDLGALPQSRLGTNIPSGGMPSMRNRLPQGTSSNGLLHQQQHLNGRMAPPSSLTRSQPMSSPGLIRKAEQMQPSVYVRPSEGIGTGGASTSRTETNVSGQIKRNSLLKPQN